MRAVNDAVEDRVSQGGIPDDLVPAADRDLAGDQQRTLSVAVVDDLEQVAALLGIERLGPPVVDDQQADALQASSSAAAGGLRRARGEVGEQRGARR